MSDEKNKRCRHGSTTWIICGGRWEWCWACGALREMELIGANSCRPKTRWQRPVGPDGKNPYPPKEIRR